MSHIVTKRECHIYLLIFFSRGFINLEEDISWKKRYFITEEEIKRYILLKDVVDGKINLKKAQEILGLSYRQMIRLKKRFILEGILGLVRKRSEKPNSLKVTEKIRRLIVALRKSIYFDFNILHFRDKLSENHNVNLSYETMRRI